jgi:hypothetical protein
VEPVQGSNLFMFVPRVLAALEPWAEISERLRRIFKLNQSRVPDENISA